jgi:hypothetical protein
MRADGNGDEESVTEHEIITPQDSAPEKRARKTGKARAIFGVALLIIAIIPIGLWSKSTNNGSGVPIAVRIERVEKCLEPKPGEVVDKELIYDTQGVAANEAAKIQSVKNQCAVKALGIPTSADEVYAIISSLINAAKKSENVQVACHEIGHELGGLTWKKLREKGLVLGLELCTYGFYHGYMRAAITSENGKSRVPFLVDFCGKQASEFGEFQGTRYDFCAHGVGHAIGSAHWPIPESTELCQEFPMTDANMKTKEIAAQGGTAGWCVTGVFNELFISPWDEGIKTSSDAIKSCNNIDKHYLIHCAQYAVQNSGLQVDQLKKECDSFEVDLQTGCWQGTIQMLVRRVLFPNGENRGLEYYKNPQKGADLVDSICKYDETYNCAREFAANSMSTVQQPSMITPVCALLARVEDQYSCKAQVESIAKSNTYLD